MNASTMIQKGIVAMCRDHHPEADADVFERDEFLAFKRVGRDREEALGARFNWMRHRILAVVGGSFYYEVPTIVHIRGEPVIWFNRDERERLLINVRMLTTSGEPRMLIEDNFWLAEGSAEHDIECPPSGKLVKATYPNGDRLVVQFREIKSLADLEKRYPPWMPADVARRLADMGVDPRPRGYGEHVQRLGIDFPVAAVGVQMKVAGAPIDFGARQTKLGTNRFIGNWVSRSPVGFDIAALA